VLLAARQQGLRYFPAAAFRQLCWAGFHGTGTVQPVNTIFLQAAPKQRFSFTAALWWLTAIDYPFFRGVYRDP